MDGYRIGWKWLLLAAITLPCVSGCSWLYQRPPHPLPPVFTQKPTLDELVAAVNRNSSQIQSFSTHQASISVPGVPTLHDTSVVFERPRRLRLTAGMDLMGTEFDLGSNDELFWVWVRHNQPPAIYFCRHEQFATCPLRDALPVDPNWLIEAFGVVEFSLHDRHQGPFTLSNGALEVRTTRQTPDGPALKRTVLDPRTACVLEQHVYDAQNRLVASAVARQHRRDPLSGLIMPKTVDLQCPLAGFTMTVNLGNVAINSPQGIPPESWVMPNYPGYERLDLCDPTLRLLPAAAASASRPNSAAPSGSSRGSTLSRRWNRLLR